MTGEKIVAVGFLSEKELALVGQTLRRVYRIDEEPGFADLLQAIDQADQQRERVAHQQV